MLTLGVYSPAQIHLETRSVQQSDLLRPLLLDIANFGLTYAYHQYREGGGNCRYKYKPTQNPKHVIIVGAGMAGLAAAYELAQVGHKVTVLEEQQQLGGRVKTYGEKEGFAKGLHSDGMYTRIISESGGQMLSYSLFALTLPLTFCLVEPIAPRVGLAAPICTATSVRNRRR